MVRSPSFVIQNDDHRSLKLPQLDALFHRVLVHVHVQQGVGVFLAAEIAPVKNERMHPAVARREFVRHRVGVPLLDEGFAARGE